MRWDDSLKAYVEYQPQAPFSLPESVPSSSATGDQSFPKIRWSDSKEAYVEVPPSNANAVEPKYQPPAAVPSSSNALPTQAPQSTAPAPQSTTPAAPSSGQKVARKASKGKDQVSEEDEKCKGDL